MEIVYAAWGYAGGIEFYPMESNLHFFLAYVGRSYKSVSYTHLDVYKRQCQSGYRVRDVADIFGGIPEC